MNIHPLGHIFNKLSAIKRGGWLACQPKTQPHAGVIIIYMSMKKPERCKKTHHCGRAAKKTPGKYLHINKINAIFAPHLRPVAADVRRASVSPRN